MIKAPQPGRRAAGATPGVTMAVEVDGAAHGGGGAFEDGQFPYPGPCLLA